MKTVAVKLPESLDKKLAAAAKRAKTTKSAVARRALVKYLNGSPSRSNVTVADIAGDLIGRLEGPGDLSCNPDHMRGFGE